MNLPIHKYGKTERRKFGKINEVIDIPNLVEIQKESYDSFINEGISEIFEDYSPITDFSDHYELHFLGHEFGDTPKYDEKECRNRDATYALPLRVKVRLVNKVKDEIIDSVVFMGDFPLMTDNGSFIINGAERVIVSQLVRSPGVNNVAETDKTGKKIYETTVIPNRGAWLEFKQDPQGVLWVSVDRKRKLTATVLLRALGYGSNRALEELFGGDKMIAATIERDEKDTPPIKSESDGLIALYRRLRPGEVPTEESVRQHLNNLFFDPRRYDVVKVGRYKFNKKLNLAYRLPGCRVADDIFHPETGIYAEGTQTAQAVALYLGLVPEGKEQLVADKLCEVVRANHHFLDFGLLGSKTVPAMLTRYGYVEDAMKMVTKTDAPSWGYWVETMQYTTLPETWTLSPKFRDASLNHVFMGDVSAWMMNQLAGINYASEEPGFRHILITPHFVEGLDWVKGAYHSVRGLVTSEWKKTGDEAELTVTIPADCTAEIRVGDERIHVGAGTHVRKFALKR